MPLKTFPVSHVRNGAVQRSAPYSGEARALMNAEALARAKAEITTWPGYARTPLVALNGLARELGIGALYYKDEAHRFGLNSFKALGGAYAVLEASRVFLAEKHGIEQAAAKALLDGRYRRLTSEFTVATATDGNHGRAVAWGAQMFGCDCVIYLHRNVSKRREAEIARYGAHIRRVEGNYIDSVRECAEEAAREGSIVVADTAVDTREWRMPALIMQGYQLLIDEALEQLPKKIALSHVFMPGGVGGLAAAVCAYLWEHFGTERPRMVVVEPERADCILRSLRAGAPTRVPGDAETFMACLSSAEISPVAWPILKQAVDDVIAVPDEASPETMRVLAAGINRDRPIVAGESGCAATAGLIAAALDDGIREVLGIDDGSVALVVGSEGATDAETYERVVGRPASAVAG